MDTLPEAAAPILRPRGTARIEVSDGRSQPRIVASATATGPTSATIESICLLCLQAVGLALWPDSVVGTYGGTDQLSAFGQWEDGSSADVTIDTRFSSSNSGIVSVQNTPGQAGNGRLSFTGVGSAILSGSDFLSTRDEPDPLCYWACPIGLFGGTAPAEVVSVTVSLNPSSVQPQGQTTITVNVQPARVGRSVNLSVQEVAYSGGHSHTGRPLGSLAASSGTTGGSGNFQTTYTASSFGGGETIRATSDASASDSTTLTVEVSGLAELGSGSHYNLTGSKAPQVLSRFL